MRSTAALLVSMVFVAVLLAGCGGDNRSPQEHIDDAIAFQQQGKWNAAIEELKNALQKSPQNSEARFLLGNTYIGIGDTDAAAKELQRSLELGYDPTAIAVPLITTLLNQKKFQALIDLAQELPQLAGDAQVRMLIMRGHANVGLSNFTAADELYDMAMSLRDDTAEARFGKAQVQAHRGNLDKARQWIADAVEIDIALSPAWSLLGDIENFEGNLAEAELAYTQAINAKPNSVHELASRALARLAQGKVAEAEKDVATAVRLNNKARFKQPLAYFAQGQLHLKRDRYAKAVQALDTMLEYQPNYLPARYYLGIAFYKLGSLEQADQNATLFRKRAPNYPGAHRLYAAVKFSKGEYDEAQEVLESLLSFQPDDTWSLAMLADIALVKGDTSQSVEGYRRLVNLFPDSFEANRRLALGLMIIDPDQARQVLLRKIEEGGDAEVAQIKTLVLLSYLRAERWDEAILAGKDLIEQNPKNWDAYTLLGGAYVGSKEVPQARVAFGEALKLRPGNLNAATNLARFEIQSGNIAAARDLYEQVLEHDPKQIAPVLYLNALDQQEGKIDEALARLEAAINIHSESLTLKLALARLYLSIGQPSRVLALSYELNTAEANSPAMLQVLGDAQYALGEAGGAAESYEKLIRQVPGVATLHFLLGRSYAAGGKLDDANAQLQKALAIDSEHFSSQLLRLHLLRITNKGAEANRIIDGLAPEYADRPEVLIEKGWLAMYQGKFKEAENDFAAAYEKVPASELLVQLGVAQWNSGHPQAAVDGYKAWLKNNPGDPRILIHLANTYLQWGRDSDALEVFRELAALNPENPVVLNNLAWLLRMQDPDEALEYAETAVRLAPDWSPALDTLGSIQLEQGDLDRAYRSFEQALRRTPGNPDIRYHLAAVSSRQGDTQAAVEILNTILADPANKFASRKEAEQLLSTLE